MNNKPKETGVALEIADEMHFKSKGMILRMRGSLHNGQQVNVAREI